MANLISTNVEENEIVKADDLNNGYNASITNITNTLKAIFEHRQDFVVGGEISAYSGMGISIKPVFGICTNDENGDPAADVVMESEEKINAATVSQGYSVDRIDTVEIRGNFVGTTQQQRAFIDFETNTQTLQNVMTKNELQLEIRIKKNDDDGVYHSAAPEKDDGWIKIAEIFVPANCNDIDICTINNISADVYDMENTEWTSEKKVTYNIGRISDINERFRVGHNKDGSHKAGVIGKNEINRTGTDSNKVTSGDFQLGGSVTTSGTTKSSTDSILDALQMLATKITDIYTPYLSNGAFKFKAGEIVISKSAAYDAATAVKIGANGDGTAYLKIGDNKVFDITAAGQIRMKSGYSAGNALDVVTKSVTDALATRMTTAENNITNLTTSVENVKVFANEIYSRYIYKGYTRVATTANITLSGSQTIDGITVSAGDSVLVKNQTDKKQNGIYQVQTGAWNRYSGYTAGNEANLKNKIFYVSVGTTQAGKAYFIPDENFTIGTTAINFNEAVFSVGNYAGKIVMRDKDGNFSAGTITASLNGSACNALCLGSSPAANYAKCAGATFANANFGCALKVCRSGSANMAAIGFINCLGTLGYIAQGAVNGKFKRYTADSTNSYEILDTSAAVTIAQGGTGATTAAAARTCLGAMAAICANGYYGMATPDGNTCSRIRTTSLGIIPDKAATDDATSTLGTNTWHFKSAYINTMYGCLCGVACNATHADTVKMTTFTANADRPILISCPVTTWSGDTGYPDGSIQGISTGCSLTFNPATGVLKAKTFCGTLSGTASTVTVTQKAIGSLSVGCPLLFGSTDSGNTSIYGSCCAIRLLSDATSTKVMVGISYKVGALGLYTTGGSYAMLKAAASTACYEITLPAKTGTVALTCDLGTASACAATAFLGATAKACCAATADNATYAGCIRVTATKDTAGTSYPLIFTAGEIAGSNYLARAHTNGIRYATNADSTSAVKSELIIGNSIACGTSGNRYGFITLYGYGAYYTVICAPSSTAARTACLPDKSGTLAMTSDITLAQATSLSAFACSTTATPPTTNPTAGKIFGYARSYTNCAAKTQTTSYDRRTCWCMNVQQICNACSGSVNLYVCSYQCCYSGTAGVETCSSKRFAFCSDGSFCAPNKIFAPALCSCSTTFGSLSVKRNCSNLPAGIAFCNCEGLLGYLSSSSTANGQFKRYKADGSTQYTILDTSAAVTIAQGGTGATTAAAARTCLGLGTAATCAATAFLGATATACSAASSNCTRGFCGDGVTYAGTSCTACPSCCVIAFQCVQPTGTSYYIKNRYSFGVFLYNSKISGTSVCNIGVVAPASVFNVSNSCICDWKYLHLY